MGNRHNRALDISLGLIREYHAMDMMILLAGVCVHDLY